MHIKQDHTPPRIILVAGVPRSGSTWLFNAARPNMGIGGITPVMKLKMAA